MKARRILFRNITLVVLLCFAATFFTACTQKLSDDFDREALKSKVNDVIGYISDRDSEGLRGICNVQMKEALTDDVLNKIFETIGEGGTFKEITDLSMSGSKNNQTEEEYAVVVAKAKYEYRNFIYTISFTKQMKLAGLYYK